MHLTRDRWWPAAAAAALFAVAVVWGRSLDPTTLQLDAPPFVGQWDIRVHASALLPLAAAPLLWLLSPRVQALPWRRALLGSWAMAMTWAVALAATDGVRGFTGPLTLRDDYLHDVGRVGPGFLETFTQHVQSGPGQWTTHVAGHPPGLLLLLKALDAIGLGGAWPEAVLFVTVGTSATVAVLLTVRRLVSEDVARRALPFVALFPGLLWVATSADGFFLGVTAWGLALCALALPLAGGLVLGISLMLTYGAVPLGLLALVLLRRPRAVATAAAGVTVVLGTFAALGFWWFDGLHQTYLRVQAGAGGYRPLEYFVVANVAVLAVAAGPAAWVALRNLSRQHRLWLLVGPVLAALLVADLTGSMRGEVERIWLPYAPWLLVSTALLIHPRRWLAAQLALALGLQLVLRSKW